MTVQLRTPLGSGQDGLHAAHILPPWRSLKKRPGWCDARVPPLDGNMMDNHKQSWKGTKESTIYNIHNTNTFAIIRTEIHCESTSLRSNSACLGCWNHPKKPGQVRSAVLLRTLGEDFKVLEPMVSARNSLQNIPQTCFVKDQFWPWTYIKEVSMLKTSLELRDAWDIETSSKGKVVLDHK